MRFLLDECCAPLMAHGLRQAGHDVRHVLAEFPGAPDEPVLIAAASEGRILVTEDVGIGATMLLGAEAPDGMILLRLGAVDPRVKLDVLLRTVARHADRLRSQVTVVESNRVRQRPLRG